MGIGYLGGEGKVSGGEFRAEGAREGSCSCDGEVLLSTVAGASPGASMPAETSGCVSWTTPGEAALYLELFPAQGGRTMEVLRSSPRLLREPALTDSRR